LSAVFLFRTFPLLYSISSTLYEQIYTLSNTLLPKNYKTILWLEKKLRKTLLYKKGFIKCWWNWHYGSISPTFSACVFCTNVFFLLRFFSFVRKMHAKNVGEIDTLFLHSNILLESEQWLKFYRQIVKKYIFILLTGLWHTFIINLLLTR